MVKELFKAKKSSAPEIPPQAVGKKGLPSKMKDQLKEIALRQDAIHAAPYLRAAVQNDLPPFTPTEEEEEEEEDSSSEGEPVPDPVAAADGQDDEDTNTDAADDDDLSSSSDEDAI
ncbi:DNA polymerase epsilon subunit D-like [Abrus precatorius]|uniref:DNA polymerase epsilon subunit D-like n=1 Tax=Abrus precatorius TaxID=3816 RepID=A0A8B8KIN3_ABRPR|nr:DNA polymerase epsilon subunit D-like [Abrus precatorius]